MNKGRRLVAGAAIACGLVTPSAALADSSPNPAGAPGGFTPGQPTTTVPLPDAVTQCLGQGGFPTPATGTNLALPAPTGALPTTLTGTIPLPAVGAPTTTGTTTTSTIPLTGLGVPAPGGSSPIPGGGGNGTGGLQCGQMIVNNNVYLVTVTITTTTTNAGGPIAAGPVSVTGNTPATAPVAMTPATTHKRTTRRHRSRARKHGAHRRAHPRARVATRALHILLVKKGGGSGTL